MMLKDILSISGKPGLYKMISQSKNMIIIESLLDGKRAPAFTKDKIISLGDIAIFTNTEEVPLAVVFEKIKLKENGSLCGVDPKSDNNVLRAYLEEILPDFDKDRVYPSDMRKLFSWYNLLIKKGFSDFTEKDTDNSQVDETNT